MFIHNIERCHPTFLWTSPFSQRHLSLPYLPCRMTTSLLSRLCPRSIVLFCGVYCFFLGFYDAPRTADHFDWLSNNASATKITQTAIPEQQDACFYDNNAPKCCTQTRCAAVHESSLASVCCNRTSSAPPTWPMLIAATPRSGTVYLSQIFQGLGLDVQNDGSRSGANGHVSWIHVFDDPTHFGLAKHRNRNHIYRNETYAAMYHLVRSPLESLTSIAFTEPIYHPAYWAFLQRHVVNLTEPLSEMLAGPKQVDRMYPPERQVAALRTGMEFFVQWHKFIDSLSVPRIRLEDLNADLIWRIYQDLQVFQNHVQLPHQYQYQQQQKAPHLTRAAVDAYFQAKTSANDKSQERRTAGTTTNSRPHRPTVTWSELCAVDTSLTKQLWNLAQRYGYYLHETIPSCAV